MLRVFNLLNDQEIFFDDHTVPEYAVRYCHAVESEKLASWFFNATLEEREILKITNGRKSIACGNWATLKP
jgi:hypothetical protein